MMAHGRSDRAHTNEIRHRKPKLLFVVNVSWFFLSHRLPLALEAKRRGFEVHVATAVASAEDRLRLEEAGLTVHPLEMSRSGENPFSEAGSFLQLFRLYGRLRPDLVHHVAMKAVLLGGLVARMRRVPAVIAAFSGLGYMFTARGFGSALRRAILMPLLRLALGGRTVAVFQNPDDARLLMKARAARPLRTVLIRGSGVDVEKYKAHPEPEGEVRVLLAARMLRDKGVVEFVDAARRLRVRGVTATFLLAGDPDPGNPATLEEEALKRWNAEGHVVWLGHQADMPSVISGSHVVCLPSYREGLPKILLEAAACGRPIVATDVPGCREIVSHGVNGFLVPPRNVDALADALELLIGDKALRARFGLQGRLRAQHEFSLQRIVDETFDLYERLLQGRPIDSVEQRRLNFSGVENK